MGNSIYYKISQLAITFLIGLFVFQYCTSSPPVAKNFKGYSEIKEGDDTKIEWEFVNTDYVKVEGIAGTFSPKDYFFASPKETTKYRITAYSNDDSINYEWSVYVKKESEPIRGPKEQESKTIVPSYRESNFLSGIIKYNKNLIPKYIKIIRALYPDKTENNLHLNFILLDAFGNHISGINQNDINLSLDFINETHKNRISSFTLIEKDEQNSQPLNIGICIDNSAIANNNLQNLNYIIESLENLSAQDNLMFTYYNHNSERIIATTPALEAIAQLKNIILPQAGGLNATYKAAFMSIVNQSIGSERKASFLIIITFGADNASIIYDSKDVIEVARELKIPVYVIGVGNAIESYSLKYLSNASGGSFYYISENDLNQIKDIIREIILGHRFYYQLAINTEKISIDSSIINSRLNVLSGTLTINDKYDIVMKVIDLYSKYQSIAAFNEKDDIIEPSFNENLKALARVMMDNPSYVIQLIGHSSNEGDDMYNKNIGLKRAQAVRRKLLELGASPNQIRVRTEGWNMPLYYLQNHPWQNYYNRRVEVRWLDPELLPFEIITGSEESETKALEEVMKWEDRGYQSYFQRYLHNNDLSYRIKLWGYKTYNDAEDAVKKIRKEQNIQLIIE